MFLVPIDDDISSLATDYTLSDCVKGCPANFPRAFWKYVADTVKPLVAERWSRYSSERLAEIVEDLDHIDICKERPASLSYVKAQCYANIDCYYHPDEANI